MAGRGCRRCSAEPRCEAKPSWEDDTRALDCPRGAAEHSDRARDAQPEAACSAHPHAQTCCCSSMDATQGSMFVACTPCANSVFELISLLVSSQRS